MFVVRYLPHVQVKDRKHVFTLGKHETWVDAEDARLATPVADILEVIERRPQTPSGETAPDNPAVAVAQPHAAAVSVEHTGSRPAAPLGGDR